MIEINYVPIYMKINHIFFVIKGKFPVMDYIPNTKILYFIVHRIYVLCLFYCMFASISYATCEWPEMHRLQLSLVLFCSVGILTFMSRINSCSAELSMKKVL